MMNVERAAKAAARRLGIPLDEYLARRSAGEKWCYRCQAWHPIRRFGVDKTRRDGRYNVCKPCVARRNIVAYHAGYTAKDPSRYPTGGRPANSRYEDIWRLRNEGLNNAQIARELGCSYWSVRRTIMRAEHPEAYAKEREEARARLKERPTLVSLDQAILGGNSTKAERMLGAAWVDDPVQADMAERLRSIVGDMEPEDVRLLDHHSLERLKDRLREEGLVPRGVQHSERERLRDPDRHTGSHVGAAPLIPGRKTREQKVAHKAANRARGNSNRLSQKPRTESDAWNKAR